MTPSIFVEQPDGTLVSMAVESYEAEAVLQKLLADYPDLLVGESEGDRW